jgi:predicted Zn-ribbon and HTH transcriptional regulator
MKTPEEILKAAQLKEWPHWPGITERLTAIDREIVIEAMKEFGRQAWIKCAFTFDAADDRATESISYNEWLQSLYLNQIAKDAQERGEYELKPEKCEHKNSYFFHDNAPRYCPDCKKYIDGENES